MSSGGSLFPVAARAEASFGSPYRGASIDLFRALRRMSRACSKIMSKNNAYLELLRRAPNAARRLEAEVPRYRILPAGSNESLDVTRWIETTFPIIGQRIDWSQVPGHDCSLWTETADLLKAFDRMVSLYNLRDADVVVTWSDGSCPSVALSVRGLLKVAVEMFEADFDTWIICATQNWCIEIHHDGSICFAYGRP